MESDHINRIIQKLSEELTWQIDKEILRDSLIISAREEVDVYLRNNKINELIGKNKISKKYIIDSVMKNYKNMNQDIFYSISLKLKVYLDEKY